jgi:hypothetical protein
LRTNRDTGVSIEHGAQACQAAEAPSGRRGAQHDKRSGSIHGTPAHSGTAIEIRCCRSRTCRPLQPERPVCHSHSETVRDLRRFGQEHQEWTQETVSETTGANARFGSYHGSHRVSQRHRSLFARFRRQRGRRDSASRGVATRL